VATAVAIINPAEHDLRAFRRRTIGEVARAHRYDDGEGVTWMEFTHTRTRNDPQKAVPPTGVHYAHIRSG